MKSHLVPTVDKDGKLSEVTVPYFEPYFLLPIKVPTSSLLKFRTEGDIVIRDKSPVDKLYLESFMFEADKCHRCRVVMYISTELFKAPDISEGFRIELANEHIKKNMNWFFTYGERIK